MVFKKVDFSSFFRDYIKSPLVVSLCFHSVLFFLVFAIWLTWLKFPAEREQGLYSALREKNNSRSAADSLAQLLKLEYKQGKEKGVEELIKALHKNFTWFGIMPAYEEFLHFTGDIIMGYLNIKTERDTIIIFVNRAIKNEGKEIDYLIDIIWEKKQNVLKILRKDADAGKIKAAKIPKFKNFFLLWSEMLSILLFFGFLVSLAYYTEIESYSDNDGIVYEIPLSKLLFFVIFILIFGGLVLFILKIFAAFLLDLVFCWIKKIIGKIFKKQIIEQEDLKVLSKNDNCFEEIANEKDVYREKLKLLKDLRKKQRKLRKTVKVEEIVKSMANFRQEEELRKLDEWIIYLRLKLEELGNEIEAKQREYFAKQAERESLEKQLETADEKLLSEFERILSLPEITALEMIEDRIEIYTGTVRKACGKKIYILGGYIISLMHKNGKFTAGIMMEGSPTLLKIKNPASPHSKNKIHPYVCDNGRFPCLGDATYAIYLFIEKQELYAAVVNIIRILYFYDVPRANPINPIEEWPCVKVSLRNARKILKKQKEAGNGLS